MYLGGPERDGDLFILGRNDLWCWQSALLEFSYFERQGPALVDLARFGYFATRLIKPAGLAAIRGTPPRPGEGGVPDGQYLECTSWKPAVTKAQSAVLGRR
jgi:hypothetical protein